MTERLKEYCRENVKSITFQPERYKKLWLKKPIILKDLNEMWNSSPDSHDMSHQSQEVKMSFCKHLPKYWAFDQRVSNAAWRHFSFLQKRCYRCWLAT